MDSEGHNHFDIGDAILTMRSSQTSKGLTGIQRFMNDPHATTFADHSFQMPPATEGLLSGSSSGPRQPARQRLATALASSMSDLSTESSDSLSRSSTNDTTSSGVTSVSESAHQADPSIILGPLPSHYTRSVVGDFGYHDHAARTLDNPQLLICFLGVIDLDQSRCHEISLSDGPEALCRHLLSHFHPVGPPGYALCAFCNAEFADAVRPKECWKTYAAHLYESHFRNGADIDDSRPDFRTLRYMLDKDLITQERYDYICWRATERKGKQYEHLMPADWVPDRVKSMQYLAEDDEYNTENRVVVKNENRRREQDRRERDRRRRPSRA